MASGAPDWTRAVSGEINVGSISNGNVIGVVNSPNTTLGVAGTVTIGGTTAVNIASITGGVTMPVSGDVTATIANATLNVAGSVDIANVPAVTLSGNANAVNVANTPAVTLSGNANAVNIANTPAVTVSGTTAVNIASITGGVTMPVSGDVTATISNATLTVAGTVAIGSIQAGNVIEVIGSPGAAVNVAASQVELAKSSDPWGAVTISVAQAEVVFSTTAAGAALYAGLASLSNQCKVLLTGGNAFGPGVYQLTIAIDDSDVGYFDVTYSTNFGGGNTTVDFTSTQKGALQAPYYFTNTPIVITVTLIAPAGVPLPVGTYTLNNFALAALPIGYGTTTVELGLDVAGVNTSVSSSNPVPVTFPAGATVDIGTLPAVDIAAGQSVAITGNVAIGTLPAVDIAAGQSVGVTGNVAIGTLPASTAKSISIADSLAPADTGISGVSASAAGGNVTLANLPANIILRRVSYSPSSTLTGVNSLGLAGGSPLTADYSPSNTVVWSSPTGRVVTAATTLTLYTSTGGINVSWQAEYTTL